MRGRLANGSGYDWDEEEEEDNDKFKVKRSATSPPLLESITRPHPPRYSSPSNDQGRPRPLSPDIPEDKGKQNFREIRISAKVHDFESTSPPQPVASSKPQLLSVEPSDTELEEGEGGGSEVGVGEIELEIEVAGTKTFSLKFSEEDV